MGEVFRNLDWSVFTNAIISIIPALICISFHEFSHGFVAWRLGDDTAKSMGRLSLNPIKHIDPFGLLMMALFKFGWAKPVPVNMMKFKNPKIGMAITALAGPVSNILLACVVFFVFGLLYTPLGGIHESVALKMIGRTAEISVALAVFNCIPIPPLDGSKVLFSMVSDTTYFKLMRYERFGMIFLIIILTTNVFDESIGRVAFYLYDKLFAIAETAFRLVN